MMGMIFRMSGPAAMLPETMLENLQRALSRFASGPLRGGAAQLLETLGYRSERTGEEEETAEFLAWADARNQLTPKQRAQFASWRRAALVFQVTADEIAEQAGQASLSGQDAFDRGRIQSFLFLAVDLAVDLAAGAYARDSLTAMTRAVNRLFPMPVVVLFRHGSALTLAVVHRRAHRRDDERDVLEKVTLVKDIDLAEPRRAHLEILRDLALPRLRKDKGVRNFDGLHAAWEAALDIEALNRRFYGELFQWFERAVAQCRFPDDGAGRGGAERHVIRLITRLLFIWFLKEKELVPGRLFDESFAREALKRYDPDKTDYYRAVLQNLFFATLNTEIARRAFSTKDNRAHRDFNKYRCRALLADPQGFLAMLRGVPFVNGGLFDCLDDFEGRNAGGRRIDAFTDNPAQHRDLSVPASLFFAPERGLFPLFERYKFTVEENTPLDRDVALDPELLGRVFENLLAAYNPETQETARKATGSYYTPRHIVDYMVDEALTAALAANSKPADGNAASWRDRLRYLLDYEDAFDDAAELFDAAETEAVIRAVAGLRVLDPAAGSGAFPMGVLHKLTLALRRLDPDNARWEKLQKEQAGDKAGKAFEAASVQEREEELLDISRTFEIYRDSDFGRKLYLMQNGIFGVDIQPVACQIAKLRFFISLVIEQRANDDPQDNYGIRPLPNLETRFVAADALIGLGVKKGEKGVLGSDAVGRIENDLQRVRERYFNARTRDTKLKLRKEDAALRADLAEALQDRWVAGQDSAEAVAGWDPYDQNACVAWFDAEWMFGVTDGFHVVIGNPPYVRADFPDDRHKINRAAILGSGYYETLWQKWDMFVPFMERGFKLLAEGGVSSLIVSDAFGHAKYALKARKWFLSNACIERIDFYSRIKVFEAAVHNLSYLFRKAEASENEPLRRLHEPVFGQVKELSTGKQKDLSERVFFPGDLYRPGPRPPSSPTVLLGDLCYVSKGMVVHAHEGRARGAFTLEDVVSDAKDATHPKPFVEGKHLSRWLPMKNRWIEWGTDRAPALFSRRTFPELYEVGEKLLSVDMSANDVRPRVTFDNRQLHHNHSAWTFVPWHGLLGVRNRSIQKQARYPDEKQRSKFLRREDLERNSRRFSIKYLLGVMNSAAAQDFLRAHRRSNIHLYPDDWKKLPIPDVPRGDQQPIVDLVDAVLAAKQADPTADVTGLERKLDRLVYKLYGLDERDD